MRRRAAALLLVAALAATGACAARQRTPDQAAPPPNTLTDAERAEGFRLLFDGRTTAGWRGFRRPDLPPGWEVRDGLLLRTGDGGDIITDAQFGDFELRLEWRVAPGGNSGIFYRVTEAEERTYHTGPEMQVLDDAAHRDGASPLTSAGAVYGLYPAPRGLVRPAGEWNAVRLVVRGARVEHWLNGTRVAAYELGSPEWEAKVRASKFVEWPAYGRARRGHIALQDHGDLVAFRSIRLREFP